MNNLDDRMKQYESQMARQMCLPLVPILARLDGKNFHKVTKHCERPFDKYFHDYMIDTTKYLVKESCANCGYTQSDEITLVYYIDQPKTQLFMAGRVQKMVSILASMATMIFNAACEGDERLQGPALFDCRVWQVPTVHEAANVFVWREQDATRNSVSMAAQYYYSHKQLQYKSAKEMQEMLHQKDINWNDYPDAFKRGTYIQRRKRCRLLTPPELACIPKSYQDPLALVERTEVVEVPMPILTTVVNRMEVLLFGKDPVVEDEDAG